MSGRLVKEVLKILEESKHQWNPDGTEEDELGDSAGHQWNPDGTEEDELGDSGGLFLCNRFENLPIEDNEGHIEETEIYVETNVQLEVKDSSKKNKGKEIDYTWDETLEDNVEEVEALGDSSKGTNVQPEVKDSSKKNKGKEIDYTWDETLEDNVEEVEALGDSSLVMKYKHRTLMNVFDKSPLVDKDVFVAPSASVIGDVQIGKGSSIWYGCVLRGDVNNISAGSGTNIQDNTLVHVAKTNLSGKVLPTLIGDNVTVGHSAVIHGCTVEDEAFVGMGATLLDGVVVEKHAMVAAGASSLLEIVPKYLNLEKQMTAVYGSDFARSLENRRHGRYGEQRRGSRAAYHPKNTVLTPVMKNWPAWDRSSSMEFIENKSGLKYFKYKHSKAYEEAQLMLQAAQNNYANDFKAAVEEILLRCPYHTESLMTLAEICESKGQREGVSDAIRRCVYALERAWHPLFTPFEGNCRLSCTYVENKQFFRCFLARIKMMDWAGIQKSGFETCKLLLSLHDPTDALLCVDYFALSLGEYTWLERFADEYRGGGNNSLWILPNFAYSLALARFFLERTQTGSSSNLSSLDLMKQAVMLYPTVLMKLQFKTGFVDRFKQRDILKNEPLDDRFKKVPLKDREPVEGAEPLESHPYFLSDKLEIPSLDHLINIYVARNYLIWKNRAARDLLWKAVEENISLLKKNETDARDWVRVRKAAFPAKHNEYGHLFISDFSDVMSIIPAEDP